MQEARDVIDIAVKNHIGYLLFVGGEPMVHQDLRAMTRYAAERGIHPMICTNGSLWTEENMRGPGSRRSDAASSCPLTRTTWRSTKRTAACRMSAGKSSAPTRFSTSLGVQTTASITASRLIDDYDKLPAFLATLGFKSCTFSYPLTSLASSYLSFSDSAWSITRPRN